MNTEQLNQALQMTIREMSTTSTDSMIASNFLTCDRKWPSPTQGC
ncbi:phage protein [Streptococcus pneumoniae]|nr:phage protein [Streptococcus pneumoniae]